MKPWSRSSFLAAACASALVLSSCLAAEKGPFLVKPYLQLGNAPDAAPSESMAVMWHTVTASPDWRVMLKPASSPAFRAMAAPVARRASLGEPHVIYTAALTGLQPGETFEYQVLQGTNVLFTASGHARVAPKAPYQFAVFGDCGADTSGQRELAVVISRSQPDFAFLPGDLVYTRGTAGDYVHKFFDVYNADEADPKTGAPLMRSTLFLGVVGNHDVAARDLDSTADGLAFFYNWSLPLNGMASFERPGFRASAERAAALQEASGGAFPRMSNYSFEYGNSFWLVIDSNSDVDWSKPEMRDWVAGQLRSPAAQRATWRFVGFHHPGFHSSHAHAGDKWMRVLSKTFEDGKVDIVFAGHVHNYQRTYPMTFALAAPAADGTRDKAMPGKWTLDTEFDGKAHTRAKGVIYVVTGAGGASLYDRGQGADRKSWLEFTQQFVSDVHSFTTARVEGGRITLRQIDAAGKTVDEFTLTK